MIHDKTIENIEWYIKEREEFNNSVEEFINEFSEKYDTRKNKLNDDTWEITVAGLYFNVSFKEVFRHKKDTEDTIRNKTIEYLNSIIVKSIGSIRFQ